jgi:hypothetical protein
MAASTANIGNVSEPFRELLAVYVPDSGSVNDMKVAYDKSTLGLLLNIADGGVGVWVLTFTNNFPALGSLIVNSGSQNDTPASGDVFTAVSVGIVTTAITIRVFAANNSAGTITFPPSDASAWVKIQKSVF